MGLLGAGCWVLGAGVAERGEGEKEEPGTRTSDRLPARPKRRVSQCKQSNLISSLTNGDPLARG